MCARGSREPRTDRPDRDVQCIGHLVVVEIEHGQQEYLCVSGSSRKAASS